MLRAKKQRGTMNPSNMELVAEEIYDKCKAGSKFVWEVMDEKIDMTNEAKRAVWVKKKKEVLEDVMEGMVQSMRALGPKGECIEMEVAEVKERWEHKWKSFVGNNNDDLTQAGYILDINEVRLVTD